MSTEQPPTSPETLRCVIGGTATDHEEFRAWQEGLVDYERRRGGGWDGERKSPLLTLKGSRLLDGNAVRH
jgi:hypothetical protein